jgi:hypothetical protein
MKPSVRKLVRQVWPVVLFAVAMAYLESAIVVYLREIWQIGDSLFPVLPMFDPETQRLLVVEVGREFATLVMFVALAYAVARTRVQWWAAILIAFGVWDIFYYVWLEVLLGWPASLAAWDVLFLVPGQMTGPVYAPVSVSALMVLAGVLFLHCENEGGRVRFSGTFWALLVGGFVLILVSFFTNGFPSTGDKTEADLTYWWPLLVVGDALGLAAMLSATRGLLSHAKAPSR